MPENTVYNQGAYSFIFSAE